MSTRTGVSVRMLRYYEAQGILTPTRTQNGYRDYGPAEEEIIRQVQHLGEAGMTLPVIRQFLPCSLERLAAYESCDELKLLLREQIERVDERLNNLALSRQTLSALLATFEASSPEVAC
nr:MerR family transcriptional regulator [Croceibacterium selenioxidans]